ncbi:MAG: holo-ACP synthase [Eubacteriales bacterium]
MIKGIGTDIIEISRIKKAVGNKLFIDKHFTKKEKQLFEKRNWAITTIASNFAVKEAVSKVFGTGIRNFELKEIEVLRDDLGLPYVCLYKRAKMIQDNLGINKFFISTSHNKENAVAFVVGEGD